MDKSVHKILELIQASKFEEAFRLCKRLLDGQESSDLFYYASLALFGLGHIHQSQKYIENHGRLSGYGTSWMYLVAYVELHKGHADRALLYWTRIVNQDPSDTFADPLIEEQRNHSIGQKGHHLRPERFHHYVPLKLPGVLVKSVPQESRKSPWLQKFRKIDPVPKRFIWGSVLGMLLILLVAGLSYLDVISYSSIWDRLVNDSSELPQTPVSGTVTPIQNFTNDKPRFLYQDKQEALNEFKLARDLILDKKPNQARFLLGKLELSNASFEIKERALQLRDAIPASIARDFKDNLDWQTILDEPYIYRGAEIMFTGKLIHKPDSSGYIQRLSVQLPVQTDLELLVLYDFGPQSGQERIGDLESGDNLKIFGIFYEKKDKKVIVHARSMKIIP